MTAKIPASIRSNNPGAMWMGKSAKKFGASNAEKLNDGLNQNNEIACFASKVEGGAALFDLLNTVYAGKTVKAAITKWSGGNHVDSYLKVFKARANVGPTVILSNTYLADPETAIPFAKAMAWHEAGCDYPMTDEEWAEAHCLAFPDGSVAEDPLPGPMVPEDVSPLLEIARSYIGTKEVAGKDHNPKIIELWGYAGRPDIEDDETAWCSGFCGGCASQAGFEKPKAKDLPMARSWLRAGVSVKPKNVQPGDIRVEKRGAAPSGHVCIVESVDHARGTVTVIEGNVSNQVKRTVKGLSSLELLDYRRIKRVGEVKPVIATINESPSIRMQMGQIGTGIATGAAALLSGAQESGVSLPVMIGVGAVIISALAVAFRQINQKRVAT